MGFGWQQLLLDGDTGWHIRTGDYIISHGAVPHVDLFSWSMPGADWFAWEWLTDVICSRIFLVLGMKGIVLYSGLLITLFATIVLRHMLWRGANAFASMGLTLIMMGAASVHYHARPHLITLVFFALSLWLIDADRRQPSRRIWLLVPLTVVWTNMHGGFLALIAVLGLLTIVTLGA